MTILKESIISLLNYRILEEEKSNRLYLSMSKWLNYNGYTGASKLWYKYAEEELDHAKWSYDYLECSGVLPEIHTLESPITEFDSLSEICKLSLQHEIEITNQCNELALKAFEEQDYLTVQLANKYLKEQLEEVDRQQYWVDRLETFVHSPEALLIIDKEMLKKAE